jgi:hypothetical protein
MIPICRGTILYEIEVRSVWEGPYICVAVCAIGREMLPALPIINFGPVGGNSCDVIIFKDFLDSKNCVPSTRDRPVAALVYTEETFDINTGLHYTILRKNYSSNGS